MHAGETVAEVSATVRQPVFVRGLDPANNGFHRAIWDAVAVNRRADRLPLRFRLLGLDDALLPRAKPKRASYDSYVPVGVLKTNWMRKHLDEIPAVVVLFMQLSWHDASFDEKMTECRSKVESLRQSLEGRNTRLALVLIQQSAPLPAADDALAAERATALCSACDLSPKCLFVLPLADRLHGYILRLEQAFFELAQAYYQAEIRRVKSKKELLSKSTHQSLLVRCQFKLAFFSEFRQDSQTALRHYKLAYQHLTETQFPVAQWFECKTVAGIITYKVCTLCFQHNTPLDSISHFRRHLEIFAPLVGDAPDETLCRIEHHTWLSRQYATFGELFDAAVQGGLAAVQTQHPGLYLQSAAREAVQRRRLLDVQRRQLPAAADRAAVLEAEALAAVETVFYGQWPWSAAPDGEAGRGAALLKLAEMQVDDAALVLQYLNAAATQYKRYRCPRMRRFVLLQAADQYSSMGQDEKALQLYSNLVWEYRREGWWSLQRVALQSALSSSLRLANVKEVVATSLELLHPLVGAQSAEQRRSLEDGLARVLAGRAPSEPPAAAWSAVLAERTFFMVQMHQLKTCIGARVWFHAPSAQVCSVCTAFVALNSLSACLCDIRKLSVRMSIGDYNQFCIVEETARLKLVPACVTTFQFDFLLRPADANKRLEARRCAFRPVTNYLA